MTSGGVLGLRKAPEFLQGMIETLTQSGRAVLGRKTARGPAGNVDLRALGEMLLSRRGEASGVALAQSLLESFHHAPPAQRLEFLLSLADRFGPDRAAVVRAIEIFQREDGGPTALEAIHAAAEPRRQELFRRLNLAPGGTASLVRLREDLLTFLPDHPELQPVDDDFVHLFSSWFNRGFLVLRPIDWTTSANILEKIIKYEAVHAIADWDDLRGRLQPPDRRCYAFFHPQLVDEPLIFVEIALTRQSPGAIAPLLDRSRRPIEAGDATTAVFYSISNTQKGLAGVSFGNFLIKQVVQDLMRELPNLKTFVTLSPAPRFADWVRAQQALDTSATLDAEMRQALADFDNPETRGAAKDAMTALAAAYFLKAKGGSGRPLDPVARFHLGNGACLERINFLGDTSAKGLQQSFGVMVNYLYSLDHIEANHEAFAEHGTVVASSDVKKALRVKPPESVAVPAKE